MNSTNKLTFEEIKSIIESVLFADNGNDPNAYFNDEIYDATNIEHYKGSDV